MLGIDLVRGRGFTRRRAQPERRRGRRLGNRGARALARRRCDRAGAARRAGPDDRAGRRRGSAGRNAAVRRPAAAAAHGRRHRRRARRRGLSARRQCGSAAPASTCRSAPTWPTTALTLRVRGDVEVARRVIVDRFAALDPNMAQVSTLQTLARTNTYILGDFVLAHARARRAGAAADVVGVVQRAVVSRRATHARDRRAHGARREQRAASARSC